ncbi:unnamed protein product [Trichogramma brassicae]|uniref:FYVE-type domain-containing protein n=1 Tax=Trichogramma brassicae TaxID=86971 RepID=A0A6H5IC35_9HYME|nr:unnamed protein product [Trichogramma brassicae]
MRGLRYSADDVAAASPDVNSSSSSSSTSSPSTGWSRQGANKRASSNSHIDYNSGDLREFRNFFKNYSIVVCFSRLGAVILVMVTTQPETGGPSAVASEVSGQTFTKLKQIGSGLMTATGNVKLPRPREHEKLNLQCEALRGIATEKNLAKLKAESEKQPVNRATACRVCIKSIKPEEVSRTCYECQRKVCEDCASYSTTADSDDPQLWCCSVCRRKLAPRDQPAIGKEGSLEVPMLEGLVRRHSDARLGSQAVASVGALGSGLLPPRSPDLRRHSDVSPASLKDLEKFRKVAGERRVSGGDENWEWRSKSRSGSPDRGQRNASPVRGKSPGLVEQDSAGNEIIDDEEDRRQRSRRAAGAQGGSTIRRKSRVTRQHSYDDEIKTGQAMPAQQQQQQQQHSMLVGGPEAALGLPVPLARRASAYDVYSSGPAGGLAVGAPQQHRASISAQGIPAMHQSVHFLPRRCCLIELKLKHCV